jgi:hypothetical protein
MIAPFEMNPTLKAQLVLMTNRKEIAAPRPLACSSCGISFSCNPKGACWCADEAFRLPMPSEGADCLCPDCLRKLAEAQAAARA